MAQVARRTARVHAGLLVSLIFAAGAAWLLTRERMLGMDAGPGTDPGRLGFYVISWIAMMSAMMFPSIAPMVLTFAYVQDRRRQRGALDRVVSCWLFIAGYLIIWTGFGLVAYGVFVGVRSLSIGALSWDRGGRFLAGACLVAAAAYQLTPLKNACLRRCRGPLEFVMSHWREGSSGALWMGVIHGAWCVGCCWALMAALFALGVMSIAWMTVVAVMIASEKLLPWKAVVNRLVALSLLFLGLGVALAPDQLPGLTLPDSPSAAQAMHAMHTGRLHGSVSTPRR